MWNLTSLMICLADSSLLSTSSTHHAHIPLLDFDHDQLEAIMFEYITCEHLFKLAYIIFPVPALRRSFCAFRCHSTLILCWLRWTDAWSKTEQQAEVARTGDDEENLGPSSA